jgi:hypothetical protein
VATPDRTTAVVVAWQAAERLGPCLAALTAEPGVAVLVVDNASTDRTREVVAAHPQVRLLDAGANLGFAGGCSLGLRHVTTPYAALVNDDAVVRPGWAAALEAELDAHPDCALVTGRVLLRDGRINSAGGVLDRSGRGADRGFGAPRRTPTRQQMRSSSRRRRPAWSACRTSRPWGCSTRGTSSTTRTSTWPGGCGWPAGPSGTRRTPWPTTTTAPAAVRPPARRCTPSTTAATGC